MYVVVTEGLTITDDPVSAPGFQVYEVAPVALRLAEFPAQTVPDVALTVGEGLTVTTALLVEEHPEELPVTT